MISKTSITRRLTLLFATASSLVLLALGFVVASSVEKHFEQQDMELLLGKMQLVGHSLQTIKSSSDAPRLAQVINDSLVGHHGLEMVIFAAGQAPLFTTADAHFQFDLVASQAANKPYQPWVWDADGQTYRGIAAELPNGISATSKSLVVVALDIAHHQAFMRSFLQTLWLFVAGATVLTGWLGWVAARRGLAPLRAMREQTQVVSAAQLNHRLAVESVPVELAELAQSLNEMLARLEDAFLRLSDFSSDIAHELRTPVTNLLTQTQVALSQTRDSDQYRNILESNAEECERMACMISDMLLLAKAENGLVVPHRETLDLSAEVHTLFDYYDAVAEEKHLQLKVEGAAVVSADRLMMRRALGNLLSNAIRHSAPGTTLSVRIDSGDAVISIRVENSGDPIPTEYLERVFDRFFRIDPSRQRNSEGTGLGLAIAKSIVLAHGGTIEAASKGSVTCFTIRLPR